MIRHARAVMAAAALVSLSSAGGVFAAEPAAAKPAFRSYLTPSDIDPARLLPPPPADGSPRHLAELAQVHRLLATRTPEQLAQAVWDDGHEDPSIFSAALGPAFDLKRLPATAALLAIVHDEFENAGDVAKTHFARKRPWAYDPTVVSCDAGQGKKPLTSYPSGHSMTGYSLALVLAELMPEKAQALQTRAYDYAYNREICGAHYRSDTEASHALANAVITTLLLKPAITPKLEAARAELRAAGLTAR